MRISKSAFMTWLWCPKQYKFQYIDGIRQPPNIQMKMGTYFHDFAEDFMKAIDYDLMNEQTRFKEALAIMNSFKYGIKCPKIIDTYANNFIEFETKRMIQFLKEGKDLHEYHKPIFLEDRFESEPIYKDMVVYGIIDRGDPMPETSSMALLEYKLSNNINHESVMKQLAFYKIVIDHLPELKFPQITDFVGYSAIRNDVVYEPWTEKREKWVMKYLKMMYKDIQEGHFERKANLFCDSCSALTPCNEPVVNDDELLAHLRDDKYRVVDLGRIMDVPQWKVEEALDFLEYNGTIMMEKKGRSYYYYMEEEEQ